MDPEISIRLRDFSCGLFLMFQILGTVALYLKGRQHKLQRSAFYFMLYLLGISLFEFFEFFIYNILGDREKAITDMLQMTVVPLALMLLYRLTHPRGLRLSLAVLNAAPYVVALTAYVLCPSDIIYDGILCVAVAHSIFIIAYGMVAVKRFNRSLAANFSSDENLSLRWTRLFLLLYIALAAVWLVATKISTPYTAACYNVMCTIIMALLCYFVYRQEDMLEVLRKTAPDENDGGLPDDQTGTIQADDLTRYHFDEVFESVFREKHIYLNPLLNINDLAQELGTNRTYVSNYINQQLHTTFYEYVNSWRVEQAMNLLKTTDLPLQEVAIQSGFNSISSFRRYVVGKVGQTPSAYKKGIKR